MMAGCGWGSPACRGTIFVFLGAGSTGFGGNVHEQRKKSMQLMSKIREKVEGGKAVLRLFERGVLIFPVGVTMLVGVALLGGGVSRRGNGGYRSAGFCSLLY